MTHFSNDSLPKSPSAERLACVEHLRTDEGCIRHREAHRVRAILARNPVLDWTTGDSSSS